MDLPPEDPPSPGKLNFARVVLHREIMERYGDAEKPIWFNEYGWNAAPERFSETALVWKRVTEEEQALYTVRGIEYARQNWPWAGVFFIWYFRQVGDILPDDAGYYFRMVDVDFSPRRVYTAVQDRALQPDEEASEPFPVGPVVLLGLACAVVAGLLGYSFWDGRGGRRRRARLGSRPVRRSIMRK
jgi:hypothetical protein